MFNESDIIYKYTRQDAIDDEVLIDISELAKEYGFKFPVAITQGVNAVLNNLEVIGQDFTGRAWDMLTILKYEIKKSQGEDRVYFSPLFASKDNKNNIVTLPVDMWSKCHAGDNGEPVITIMLKGEN